MNSHPLLPPTLKTLSKQYVSSFPSFYAISQAKFPLANNLKLTTTQLQPFLDIVFTNFPNRVMFGSDWPVCNVGGPRGEQGNWKFWVEVVEKVLEERGMSESEKEGVWWKTGCRGYGIEL